MEVIFRFFTGIVLSQCGSTGSHSSKIGFPFSFAIVRMRFQKWIIKIEEIYIDGFAAFLSPSLCFSKMHIPN